MVKQIHSKLQLRPEVMIEIASGNDCYSLRLKMGIEMTRVFPIKNGDFPHLCQRLPEGITWGICPRSIHDTSGRP